VSFGRRRRLSEEIAENDCEDRDTDEHVEG
jgi:hypothetical protein